MKMQHPVSGVDRKVIGGLHRLWCFLFGFMYYLSKGAWGWAIISFFTFNGAWIGFPLWNRAIVKGHYENLGWREVGTIPAKRSEPALTR